MSKAIFKALKGRADGDPSSSYIELEIENGNNKDSIGDQLWFSPDGKTMDICDIADDEVYETMLDLFEHSSRNAVRGALRRMGVRYFQ